MSAVGMPSISVGTDLDSIILLLGNRYLKPEFILGKIEDKQIMVII